MVPRFHDGKFARYLAGRLQKKANENNLNEKEQKVVNWVVGKGKLISVTRRTAKDYDVDFKYEAESGVSTDAWLPLAVISKSEWTADDVYALSDGYGTSGFTPAQGKDWSAIRDSSDETIWKMFEVASTKLHFDPETGEEREDYGKGTGQPDMRDPIEQEESVSAGGEGQMLSSSLKVSAAGATRDEDFIKKYVDEHYGFTDALSHADEFEASKKYRENMTDEQYAEALGKFIYQISTGDKEGAKDIVKCCKTCYYLDVKVGRLVCGRQSYVKKKYGEDLLDKWVLNNTEPNDCMFYKPFDKKRSSNTFKEGDEFRTYDKFKDVDGYEVSLGATGEFEIAEIWEDYTEIIRLPSTDSTRIHVANDVLLNLKLDMFWPATSNKLEGSKKDLNSKTAFHKFIIQTKDVEGDIQKILSAIDQQQIPYVMEQPDTDTLELVVADDDSGNLRDKLFPMFKSVREVKATDVPLSSDPEPFGEFLGRKASAEDIEDLGVILEALLAEDTSLNKESDYKNLTLQTSDITQEIKKELVALQSKIDKDKLYTGEDEEGWVEGGLQKLFHLTILYGVEEDEKDRISSIVKHYTDKGIKVRVVGVEYFNNPDSPYTVAVARCESEELTKLHDELKASVQNKDSHPTYKIHCTIAYLKKGEKLPDETLSKTEWTVKEVEMSQKDGSLVKVSTFNVGRHVKAYVDFTKLQRIYESYYKHNAPPYMDDLLDVARSLYEYYEDYLKWYAEYPARMTSREGEIVVVQDYVKRKVELSNALGSQDVPKLITAIDNAINQVHIDFSALCHLRIALGREIEEQYWDERRKDFTIPKEQVKQEIEKAEQGFDDFMDVFVQILKQQGKSVPVGRTGSKKSYGGFSVGDRATWSWGWETLTGTIEEFTNDCDCDIEPGMHASVKGANGFGYSVLIEELKPCKTAAASIPTEQELKQYVESLGGAYLGIQYLGNDKTLPYGICFNDEGKSTRLVQFGPEMKKQIEQKLKSVAVTAAKSSNILDSLKPIPSLWYEDEKGNRMEPDLELSELPDEFFKKGFKYQVCRMPELRESYCGDEGELIAFSTTINCIEPIVMHLVGEKGWSLVDAITIAGSTCERCLNILLEAATGELYDGRDSAHTHCEVCAQIDPEYDKKFKETEKLEHTASVREKKACKCSQIARYLVAAYGKQVKKSSFKEHDVLLTPGGCRLNVLSVFDGKVLLQPEGLVDTFSLTEAQAEKYKKEEKVAATDLPKGKDSPTLETLTEYWTPEDGDPPITRAKLEKELAKGIKVEREHTNDETIAKQIALDHLSELMDYYTQLAEMEDKGKKKPAKSSSKKRRLEKMALDREQVISSNVQDIGYDPDAQIIEIGFIPGGVYQYLGVDPTVWEQFKEAESKGSFLHYYIKPFYQYVRVAKRADMPDLKVGDQVVAAAEIHTSKGNTVARGTRGEVIYVPLLPNQSVDVIFEGFEREIAILPDEISKEKEAAIPFNEMVEEEGKNFDSPSIKPIH